MNTEYVEPRVSDIDKINNLLIKFASAYIPPFSEEERIVEVCNIKDKKASCIIAVENENIIGYIVWEKYKKDSQYAYVCNLLVEPEYRRTGISIKLREIAFSDMEKNGFSGVYYTTWDTNIGMIKSSEKLEMKIEDCYLDEDFRGKGGKTYLFKKVFSSE